VVLNTKQTTDNVPIIHVFKIHYLPISHKINFKICWLGAPAYCFLYYYVELQYLFVQSGGHKTW